MIHIYFLLNFINKTPKLHLSLAHIFHNDDFSSKYGHYENTPVLIALFACICFQNYQHSFILLKAKSNANI